MRQNITKVDAFNNFQLKYTCPKECTCISTYVNCINFENFNQLNFTDSYLNELDIFLIQPLNKLILDEQFNTNGVSLSSKGQFTLENILKINIEANIFKKEQKKIQLLQMDNSNFVFISNLNTNINNENCSKIQNDANLFSYFSNIILKSNVLFKETLCPYIFHNVDLNSLSIYGLNDTNSLNFINLTQLESDRLNSRILKLEIRDSSLSSLTSNILNKYVFKYLKEIYIDDSSVDRIETTLFTHFNSIEAIYLRLKNFKIFFQEAEWIQFLNESSLVNNNNRQILLGIIDNNLEPYEFPDNDLCLFKNFPHESNVFFYVSSSFHKYKCSCTLLYLLKNWKNYRLFNISTNNAAIESCLKSDVFNSTYLKCNLEQNIALCFPPEIINTTTIAIETTTIETTTMVIETTTIFVDDTDYLAIILPIVFVLILILIIFLLIYVMFKRKLLCFKVKQTTPPPQQDVELIIPVNESRQFCNIYLHVIKIWGKKLKKNNNFLSYSNDEMSLIEAKINDLLTNEIIYEIKDNHNIDTFWLSSIIVRKNDNDFFLDLRNLNSITTNEQTDNLFFDVKSSIDLLKNANVYTIINLMSIYSQIKLDPKSSSKTQFQSPSSKKFYYFNTMPYGLVNFKMTLTKLVNLIIDKYLNQTCLLINYRLIVFSADKIRHEEDLNNIYNEFEMNNLNIKECSKEENLARLEIFGHLIENNQVNINNKEMFNFLDLPTPLNRKQMLKFIKFANNFYGTINNFEFEVNKLNVNLNQHDYAWNRDSNDKWKKIKETLANYIDCEKELLASFNSNAAGDYLYSIQLYKSVHLFGAILIRTTTTTTITTAVNNTKEEHVVAIKFKKLTKLDVMKNSFQKNLDCILWSLDVFEPYLFNKKFVVNQYISYINNNLNSLDKEELANEIELYLLLQDFNLTTNIKRNVILDELSKYLELF